MSEKPTLAESMVVQRVALIFANHAHNFQYHAGGNVESWWEGQRLNNEPVENVAESTT